jgi:glyoxylase-like metal-dependent hydrolase (beta-lactamase superfamily II)
LLAKEGITSEQITKVFLTHFHKDHIDGLGIIKEGKYQINFPNAQVFGQKRI